MAHWTISASLILSKMLARLRFILNIQIISDKCPLEFILKSK